MWYFTRAEIFLHFLFFHLGHKVSPMDWHPITIFSFPYLALWTINFSSIIYKEINISEDQVNIDKENETQDEYQEEMFVKEPWTLSPPDSRGGPMLAELTFLNGASSCFSTIFPALLGWEVLSLSGPATVRYPDTSPVCFCVQVLCLSRADGTAEI